MKTITLDLEPQNIDLERMLSDAGITYTVVDRCPLPTCVACSDDEVSVDVPAAA